MRDLETLDISDISSTSACAGVCDSGGHCDPWHHQHDPWIFPQCSQGQLLQTVGSLPYIQFISAVHKCTVHVHPSPLLSSHSTGDTSAGKRCHSHDRAECGHLWPVLQ